MLFKVVPVTILLAAVDLAAGASALRREKLALAGRHYGPGYPRPCTNRGDYGGCSGGYDGHNGRDDGYVAHDGHGAGYPDGYGRGIGDPNNIDVMVRGWGSLTSGFQQLHKTVSGGASLDVAIHAALSLRTQVQHVTSQYSSCECAAGSQTIAAFQSMAWQFFSSVQLTLQACQQRYAYGWQSQFKTVFQQYSVAFVSLRTIAASLHTDLTQSIQRAGVNLEVFASVGLNLEAMLNLNLNIGGLLNL